MEEQEEPTHWSEDRMLVVDVGAARVAFDATHVEEVVETGGVAPLPRAPAHLLGLMNHRGTALPLVDLSVFLGTATSERALAADGQPLPRRVVVTRVGPYLVGLRCERVLSVLALPAPLPGPLLSRGSELLRFVVNESDTPDHGVVATIDLAAVLEAARDAS